MAGVNRVSSNNILVLRLQPAFQNEGLNVLHWACCNPPPLSVFGALIRHRPQARVAATTVDGNGMTPLLCASVCGAPVEMIRMLLEICPESLDVTDRDMWTALHYVAYRSRRGGAGSVVPAISKVRLLLDVDPLIAHKVDSRGQTALDMLCALFCREMQGDPHGVSWQNNTSDDVMKLFSLLVSSMYRSNNSSSSSSAQPTAGSNFAHKIITVGAPFLLLWCLVLREPELMLETDSRGNTPLHLAVEMSSDLNFGVFLAKAQPRAARLASSLGETPFMVAVRRFGSFNDLIRQLICADATPLESLGLADPCYPKLFEHVNDDPQAIFGILKSRPTLARGRGGSKG